MKSNEVKEKVVEQTDVKSQNSSEKDFSINLSASNTAGSLVKENDTATDNLKAEASQKYGFDIDNQNGNYSEIYKIKVDFWDEKDQANVEAQTKKIKEDLFDKSGNELEFISRITHFNMNLSSQIGDNYNNLNKEIAKKTKFSNAESVAENISSLNSILKSYEEVSSKDFLDGFFGLFSKSKRNKNIDAESIEDKIQLILDEMLVKRQEQVELMAENDKKVFDLFSFMTELNKAIFVSREILFEVEKRRILLAEKVLSEGNESPMMINYYKDIYAQEKSLENLIRNILVVRLHLNTSFNKNSDIRSTYQAILQSINDTITFVIPSYRNLLIDYITENKIDDTIKLINLTKSARDQVENESNKNYQNIRLAANSLANESIYNIKTLEQSINIIIDTEKKIREADLKAKQTREEDIRTVNELQSTLNEYSLGKNEVKKV